MTLSLFFSSSHYNSLLFLIYDHTKRETTWSRSPMFLSCTVADCMTPFVNIVAKDNMFANISAIGPSGFLQVKHKKQCYLITGTIMYACAWSLIWLNYCESRKTRCLFSDWLGWAPPPFRRTPGSASHELVSNFKTVFTTLTHNSHLLVICHSKESWT